MLSVLRLYSVNDRMINEHESFGEMRIGSENRSIRSNLVPLPHCPSQIRHDLTRDRIRAVKVGNRRLTALAMARPFVHTVINAQEVSPKLYACRAFDIGNWWRPVEGAWSIYIAIY
jgi:hypothetical protein